MLIGMARRAGRVQRAYKLMESAYRVSQWHAHRVGWRVAMAWRLRKIGLDLLWACRRNKWTNQYGRRP
jgi:hypothetical protein